MISLKKHIGDWASEDAEPRLKAYRSLLAAVGACSLRAVPELGNDLQRRMTELNKSIASDSVTSVVLASTHQKALQDLSQWSEKAFERHEAGERELKEIIEIVAKAVLSVTERDERYAREFVDLAERLRSITSLSDMAQMRRSIIEGANSLTACVERQAADSKESLLRLSAEVEDYRSRLDKSERLSSMDPLTGLANRRRFEELLNVKIHARGRFCLILIDLNDFKRINDRLGHVAGDDVLKQFAVKLRVQFPSADLVARWGGDEFAVILSTSQKDADARIHRMRLSALGECKVNSGKQIVAVTVDASIGAVEWEGAEKGSELVARADRSMYSGKQSMKARPGG
jgi:diguanylate cyclase